MNTSSYGREPPSLKRATPQNASMGEKVSHPSGNPQLGRKGPIYFPPGPTAHFPHGVSKGPSVVLGASIPPSLANVPTIDHPIFNRALAILTEVKKLSITNVLQLSLPPRRETS